MKEGARSDEKRWRRMRDKMSEKKKEREKISVCVYVCVCMYACMCVGGGEEDRGDRTLIGLLVSLACGVARLERPRESSPESRRTGL